MVYDHLLVDGKKFIKGNELKEFSRGRPCDFSTSVHTIPSRSSSECRLINDDTDVQTDGCRETDVRLGTDASKNEGDPVTPGLKDRYVVILLNGLTRPSVSNICHFCIATVSLPN